MNAMAPAAQAHTRPLPRARAQAPRSLNATLPGATAPTRPEPAISAREWQVLQLLAQGCADEYIEADALDEFATTLGSALSRWLEEGARS